MRAERLGTCVVLAEDECWARKIVASREQIFRFSRGRNSTDAIGSPFAELVAIVIYIFTIAFDLLTQMI
jgi:hypothetical protein